MIRLFIFLACIPAYFSFSQSTVEVQLQLLTPDVIGQPTIEVDSLSVWIGKVKSEIEAHFSDEKGGKQVLVVASIHRDKNPTMEVCSRPKIDNTVGDALLERIARIPAPRTRITDYSFIFIANINGGCEEDIEFTPALLYPEQRDLTAFKELSLIEKKATLQSWIQTDVIPLLVHYYIIVDAQFDGVLQFGKMVEKGEYLSKDVEQLTDLNPNYWRAIMEMEIANQLVPFTKVCLYIAKGEFDKAKRMIVLVDFFSDNSTLPAALHNAVSSRLEMLDRELENSINKGIAMHDKGKYNDAVNHYQKLLVDFPNSAWLNYERYFSGTAEMHIDSTEVEWNKWKGIIFRCDPMYHMNVRAKTGKEAYLLFRRQKINTLFQNADNTKQDLLEYADIAFDLENYAFAGQLYWFIFTGLQEKDYDNRNILAHFLYCIDKLGSGEYLVNFNGDFPAEFEKIEAERLKLMEKDGIYKSFAK